jgi:hypothetical protein
MQTEIEKFVNKLLEKFNDSEKRYNNTQVKALIQIEYLDHELKHNTGNIIKLAFREISNEKVEVTVSGHAYFIGKENMSIFRTVWEDIEDSLDTHNRHRIA